MPNLYFFTCPRHGSLVISAVIRIAIAPAFAFFAVVPPVAAATPLSYLHGFSRQANSVVPLTWAVLIVAIVVIAVIAALVLIGAIRRYTPRATWSVDMPAVARTGNGLLWIYTGVGVSSLVLLGALIWTLISLVQLGRGHDRSPLTIEVTGQQWWWKVRYLNSDASRILTSANEIHIPIGQSIRVELIGADVIHSFWVPALNGKTDTIPGQINVTWLKALRAGRYRGQCTEYCGAQHAHMGFWVVAETPERFNAWWNAQLLPISPPDSPKAAQQQKEFEFHCGSCHTVRGTQAGGVVAPDLTHLMSRRTIAAATAPNTIAFLSGWIANPQALKPGNHMPVLFLSGPEMEDTRSFLKRLK